jgi:hypothetical protein
MEAIVVAGRSLFLNGRRLDEIELGKRLSEIRIA